MLMQWLRATSPEKCIIGLAGAGYCLTIQLCYVSLDRSKWNRKGNRSENENSKKCNKIIIS